MAALNSNGLTVRTVTALTDTVTATDDIVLYIGPGTKAVSIPAAGSSLVQLGKIYMFQHSSTGTVTLTPVSGQIDNAATKVIPGGSVAISCLTLVSDGTQWRTIEYA